jgi:hypothetical protein
VEKSAPGGFSGQVPLASYAARNKSKVAATKPGRPFRTGWVLLGLLTILLVASAGWMTRDYWMTRPPLSLTALSLSSTASKAASPGGPASIEIRWDPAALRGQDRASMFINDGGTLKELPLNRIQMAAGRLQYQPQTERVTATLHAGDLRASVLYVTPR